MLLQYAIDSLTLEQGMAIAKKIQMCIRDRRKAVPHTSIFGRVTPKQKKAIIAQLKQEGRTVGMVGDGVNDVLALKEADCSMALASGSDAAATISEIILLNSNLHSLYNVVMEGRQVINNLKRSASLFLVKTIFSFLLSLIFMIIPSNYPIVPIQFSLIGSLFIGIPSFVLALQPNRERLSGSFLGDILVSAIPGAMSAVLLVSSISIFEPLFGFTQGPVSYTHLDVYKRQLFILWRKCWMSIRRFCLPEKLRA